MCPPSIFTVDAFGRADRFTANEQTRDKFTADKGRANEQTRDKFTADKGRANKQTRDEADDVGAVGIFAD